LQAAEIGQRHAEKEIINLRQALAVESERNQHLMQQLAEMTAKALAAVPASADVNAMMMPGTVDVYARAKSDVEMQYLEHMKEQITKVRRQAPIALSEGDKPPWPCLKETGPLFFV
jgi:hypothetical protein